MISSMEAVSSECWERKWEQGDSESREMLQLGTGHMLFERMWRERSFKTAWIQVVPVWYTLLAHAPGIHGNTLR